MKLCFLGFHLWAFRIVTCREVTMDLLRYCVRCHKVQQADPSAYHNLYYVKRWKAGKTWEEINE